MLFVAFAACAEVAGSGEEVGDLSASGETRSPAFTSVWAKTISGVGHQNLQDIVAAGDVAFVAGYAIQSLDFHDGFVYQPRDSDTHAFLAAADGSGALVWRRGFRAGTDLVRVVATAEQDPVVIGVRPGDTDVGCGMFPNPGPYLAKYDGRTGLCLWMRAWASDDAHELSAVAVLPGGDLAVAGQFRGSLDLGDGHVIQTENDASQVYVARLTPRGHARWVRVLGNTGADSTTSISAFDLAADASANVYVTGHFTGRADLLGEIVDAGFTNPTQFILAIDGSGNRRWRYLQPDDKVIIQRLHQRGGRLAGLGVAQGDFTFAGRSFVVDAHETLVVELGLDGAERWARTLPGRTAPRSVVVDGDGHVDFTTDLEPGDVAQIGTQAIGPASGRIGLVAVLAPGDGRPLAANAIGSGDDNVEAFLSIGPTGLTVLGGAFVPSVHMGATTLSGDQQSDSFYMRLVLGPL